MSLQLRWVGDEERDRVAMARWLCYGHAGKDLAKIQERTISSRTAAAGDFLLAERDGNPVGTATSLSLTMWVRGSPLPCQGVAWVGAAKTDRRKSGVDVRSTRGESSAQTRAISASSPETASSGITASSPPALSAPSPTGRRDPGVATAVMREVLRKARDRQRVLTALMPFRASFYEHFGYGLAERRAEWTIPLSVLPTGDASGWRLCQPGDRIHFAAPLAAARQRMVESGQCDIERSPGAWAEAETIEPTGLRFVKIKIAASADAANPAASIAPATDAIAASVFLVHRKRRGKDYLHVADWIADSPDAFAQILHFLATLRDQYFAAILTTPADWPLNRLLREPQLPHRLVNHAHAGSRLIARMQVRVLDHLRFLQSLNLPAAPPAGAVVAVHETEGHVSKFKVDFADQRAVAAATDASANFQCRDSVWAAIATGDLSARAALRFGLAEGDPQAADALAILGSGPLPFSMEYF
jgi:hypothetical protein